MCVERVRPSVKGPIVGDCCERLHNFFWFAVNPPKNYAGVSGNVSPNPLGNFVPQIRPQVSNHHVLLYRRFLPTTLPILVTSVETLW